jgi:hypothetical protein
MYFLNIFPETLHVSADVSHHQVYATTSRNTGDDHLCFDGTCIFILIYTHTHGDGKSKKKKDLTKLIVAFRNLANAPDKCKKQWCNDNDSRKIEVLVKKPVSVLLFPQ